MSEKTIPAGEKNCLEYVMMVSGIENFILSPAVNLKMYICIC